MIQRHHEELVELLELCLQQKSTRPSKSRPRSLQPAVPRERKELTVPQKVHYVMSNDKDNFWGVIARDADDGGSDASPGAESSNGRAPTNGFKKMVTSVSINPSSPCSARALTTPSGGRRRQIRSTKTEDCLFESTKEMVRARETQLQRMTRKWYYEWFSGFLIVSNSVFIGFQTELMAHDSADRAMEGLPARQVEPVGILMIQTLFTFLFLVELALRWASDGLVTFFRTPEYLWNCMDVFIVGFSLVDSLWNLAALARDEPVDNSVIGSISVLRMVRVVRIVKIVRVIRVMSFFRELRIMVYSILGSMKSLIWVALILGVTFYIFAITFTAATITHLDKTSSWSSEGTKDLREFYGSVDKSMLSLYMAMSGGNDWGMAYHALEPLSGPYQVFFLLFITFAIFAVLNIVTGVFVDTAMSSNSGGDRQIMMHEALEGKKQYLQTLRTIFEEMDDDGGGTISLPEFEEGLNDEKVKAFFSALKLDVTDARSFFKLFDKEQEDQITLDEFLEGCYKLQGYSRSLDTRQLQRQLDILCDSVASLRAALVQDVAVPVYCADYMNLTAVVDDAFC